MYDCVVYDMKGVIMHHIEMWVQSGTHEHSMNAGWMLRNDSRTTVACGEGS